MLVPVGVALGSNQGNCHAELDAGVSFLRTLSGDGIVRESPRLETAPVDCPPGSEPFLNAVAEISVDSAALPPSRLLARLQEFERERGRPAEHERNSPRPLDLDILYYGNLVLRTSELTIPHPRAVSRLFVLEPLAVIRPDLVLPGQSQTVLQLLEAQEGGSPAFTSLSYRMTPKEILRHKKIERLAYQIYEEEGRPQGRSTEHWLEAQRRYYDNDFLQRELEVEEEEGGIIPKK